ncbi:S9 family peptidase [Shewanella sp. 202IG2-18]|uniref:prolyl oligopeptidase family serine peptidase n=1 Tax=Parashewanella hymeniacidonis TaxID=2807618 RepID=UPI001961F405|nr:S9 family peptidase [Parashewanella hymeniacidonis]
MNKSFVILSLALSSFLTQAANIINDERVTTQQDCFRSIFSSYEAWYGFIEKKNNKKFKGDKDKLNRAMNGFDKIFGKEKYEHYKKHLVCQSISYKVDGVDVAGFVIKPKVSDKKYPVLVYNRGGNGGYGSMIFANMMRGLFPIAEQGFVIIGSQYRGSLTKEDNLDEFGGKDVNDVVELFKLIPNIVGADAERIGMFGGSRGGMQTFLALKEVSNIKAVAASSGNYDLVRGLEIRPAMENVYKHRIPNYFVNKLQELEKRSTLQWVHQLPKDVPVLLIHGAKDKRVSVEHSEKLAAALNVHKIPHKLVVYPEGNHYFSKNRNKQQQEIVNWFKTYL